MLDYDYFDAEMARDTRGELRTLHQDSEEETSFFTWLREARFELVYFDGLKVSNGEPYDVMKFEKLDDRGGVSRRFTVHRFHAKDRAPRRGYMSELGPKRRRRHLMNPVVP